MNDNVNTKEPDHTRSPINDTHIELSPLILPPRSQSLPIFFEKKEAKLIENNKIPNLLSFDAIGFSADIGGIVKYKNSFFELLCDCVLECMVLEYGYPSEVRNDFKIGKNKVDGVWDIKTGYFLTLNKDKLIVKVGAVQSP